MAKWTNYKTVKSFLSFFFICNNTNLIILLPLSQIRSSPASSHWPPAYIQHNYLGPTCRALPRCMSSPASSHWPPAYPAAVAAPGSADSGPPLAPPPGRYGSARRRRDWASRSGAARGRKVRLEGRGRVAAGGSWPCRRGAAGPRDPSTINKKLFI